MKLNLLRMTCGLAIVLAAHTVSALSGYVSRVPNGSVNSCTTCHVASGPPSLNPFGSDFLANNITWNAALAAMDSDGDGYSNGQELGDPSGTGTPFPGASVSLPGFPASIPTLRPPNISISSPANGAAFSPPFTGPITATTTNPAGSITAVQFFSGATLLGTDTSTPYSLPVSLGAGSYTLTARAIDYLGASNTSAAVSITVNSAAVAPAITTQPASQTVFAGANVTFSVAATGTPPLSYQWRKNTVNISGATTTSLTLNSVAAADAGTYSAVVTNAAGSATSAGATLTVNPAPVAPAITTQPASQTVTAGANVAFTVVATGTAPLSYQWRRNSANIAGATGTSLGLTGVTTANAGTYSVVVTNVAGSATSAGATLAVNVPPAITTQPVSQSVLAGVNVTFTVAATGTAPLSYQWRKNGANIAGATASGLLLPSVAAADAGTYSAMVTNVAGSATSAGATLAINPAPVAPAITTQPASQTVTAGANVTFTVAASGTAPLSYQWRRNAVNIAGATGTSLTLNNVAAAAAGTYSAVVTNVAGTATSAGATLTVNPVVVSISLTSPTNGSTFAAPGTFSLIATASPTGSVARVEFLVGSTLLGSVSTPPYVFPMINLVAGNYAFTARAVDTAGGNTTSASVNVTVTPTGPQPTNGPAVITVTAPDPNAAEAGLDPGTFRVARTGPTTNALTVFFLLGGTAVNGQDYQMLSNFVTIATGAATADITVRPIPDADVPTEISDTVILQLTPPPTGQPPYTIGTPSNAVVTIIELNTSNLPPVVQIISPRNGSSYPARATIGLVARASDPDGTVTSVQFYAGLNLLGKGVLVLRDSDRDDDHEGSESRGAYYSLTWLRVPSGRYIVTAVATDNAGANTISAPVSLTVRSGNGSGGDGDDRSSTLRSGRND